MGAAADGEPFLESGQRATILREAPYPAAANLELSWMRSPAVQATGFHGWSTRAHVGGTAPLIWDEASHAARRRRGCGR